MASDPTGPDPAPQRSRMLRNSTMLARAPRAVGAEARGAHGAPQVERVKVTLFGAGRIGPLHARMLLMTGAVDQLVIVDVVPERAAAAAEALGGSVAPSVDEALATPVTIG